MIKKESLVSKTKRSLYSDFTKNYLEIGASSFIEAWKEFNNDPIRKSLNAIKSKKTLLEMSHIPKFSNEKISLYPYPDTKKGWFSIPLCRMSAEFEFGDIDILNAYNEYKIYDSKKHLSHEAFKICMGLLRERLRIYNDMFCFGSSIIDNKALLVRNDSINIFLNNSQGKSIDHCFNHVYGCFLYSDAFNLDKIINFIHPSLGGRMRKFLDDNHMNYVFNNDQPEYSVITTMFSSSSINSFLLVSDFPLRRFNGNIEDLEKLHFDSSYSEFSSSLKFRFNSFCLEVPCSEEKIVMWFPYNDHMKMNKNLITEDF